MCCLFCELVDQKEKHKDFQDQYLESTTHWILFLDKAPLSVGHITIILNDKNHKHYEQLSPEILADLHFAFDRAKQYISKLRPRPKPNKILNILALNDNKKFHKRGKPHFHFHVVPRYPYSTAEKRFYIKINKEFNPNFNKKSQIKYGLWWLAYGEIFRNNPDNKEEIEKMVSRAFSKMKPKKKKAKISRT